MSTDYISRKIRTQSAKKFKDSFAYYAVGYTYLAKQLPYSNESAADDIDDTVSAEKQIWDNMIAAKKIVVNNMEFVIPRYTWTGNTKYKQYDDIVKIDDLLVESDNVKPMYVINSQGYVYKCLCNNVSANSTVEPTGDFTTSNGFIFTADNYLWKYMYRVLSTNKFANESWIPVPYTNPPIENTGYLINYSSVVDGSLNKIKVINSGAGYVHSTLNVDTFIAGNNYLVASSVANVNVNMLVSGTGILPGTYVQSFSETFKTITLSNPTIGPGGGVGNTVQIKTRVVVQGDGKDSFFDVTLDGTQIKKITTTTIGQNYTVANVFIYGTGTGASARSILPPKYGHGYNPAVELGATNLMIYNSIGDVDSTENGKIPNVTTFRQYGLLLNPHKYEQSNVISFANSATVVSQTFDLTLFGGSEYTLGERVYQGSSSSNPFFSGYIIDQTDFVVKLTNTYGAPLVGELLKSSSVQRPVSSIKYPDLKLYTGDVIYNKNILKVQRTDNQSEELKIVLQF